MIEPVIRCALKGNPGNVMFVYLTALRLREALGRGRIVGVDLPMWGIHIPDEQMDLEPLHLRRDAEKHSRGAIPVDSLRRLVESESIERIEIEGFCQNTGNLPDRTRADIRSLFDGSAANVDGFGLDTLVISIRGAEILGAIHADYTLLPINFYREIVKESGLKPVFVGQLSPNSYTDQLRRTFPGADFLSGPTPLHDFERLRRSKNICLSISTFAWLAGWLSDATRIIMPLSGLFNPNQHRASWFIPEDDDRYDYFLFPINRAIGIESLAQAHDAIEGRWRMISEDALIRMFSLPPRCPRRLQAFLNAFDPLYYSENTPGLAGKPAVAALEHFMAHGFWANQTPFHIDREWYSRTYHDAAAAIGCNEFADEAHHFAAVGRRLGYQPARTCVESPRMDLPPAGSASTKVDASLNMVGSLVPSLSQDEPRDVRIGDKESVHQQFDPLTRAAIRHGSDKYGGHLYTPIYHELFEHLRDKPIRLLEIGVGGYGNESAGGLGLRMWADYFPLAEITGLDIARKSFVVNDRVKIIEGSQADETLLAAVARERGPFDVVVDDGSHIVQHMITSFRVLYPIMSSDGFYAVEDMQTSFLPTLGGRADGRGSMFEIAGQVAMAMHALEGFSDPAVPAEIMLFGRITRSVGIYRNIVVFRRGSNTYPSNHGLDFRNEEVRRVFEGITLEAAREPAPGDTLSRIDMLIWGGLLVEAAELARQTAGQTEERSVLYELVRMMEWCKALDVRDAISAKIASLDRFSC